MTNFFRRIQPQSPVLRNNYFIQVDDKLAWSESIGDEDGMEGIGWFTVPHSHH
jgi:alpha-1,2-mannosyltransferase